MPLGIIPQQKTDDFQLLSVNLCQSAMMTPMATNGHQWRPMATNGDQWQSDPRGTISNVTIRHSPKYDQATALQHVLEQVQ